MSRKKEALVLKNLDGLNSTEAHILFVAVEHKAQTIYWDEAAGGIHSLIDKGLLESVPDEATLCHKPFRITKFVWEHLQQKEVVERLKTKGGENLKT
jgi:hypothetical protein